jgi:hypothetical protein
METFDLISGRNETAKITYPLEGLWSRFFIEIFLDEILYDIKVFMIGMFFRFRNSSNVMDPGSPSAAFNNAPQNVLSPILKKELFVNRAGLFETG